MAMRTFTWALWMDIGGGLDERILSYASEGLFTIGLILRHAPLRIWGRHWQR